MQLKQIKERYGINKRIFSVLKKERRKKDKNKQDVIIYYGTTADRVLN